MNAAEDRLSKSDPAPDVLFSAGQIAARVDALADEIAFHPHLKNAGSGPGSILAVCALRGAFVFAADLVRALSSRGIDPEVAFLQVESYGAGTRPSQPVRLVRDLEVGIGDRPVLLMDDILDTGNTLEFLTRHLDDRGARTVTSAVLLDKAARREISVEADFVGFDCPDHFVVGYGMDAGGRYRGLPYVGTLPGVRA